MKKFLKKVEGFTLVELIVVIAILGILAAVAVPAYSGYIDKANEANDTQILSAVKTAADAALALETEAYAELIVTADGDVTAKWAVPEGAAAGTPAPTVVLAGDSADPNDAEVADFATFFGSNTIEFKSDAYEGGATWTSEGWAPTT